MSINKEDIIHTYIQISRSASEEEKRTLSKYLCTILSCTQDELNSILKNEDTYSFLKTQIPQLIQKTVPYKIIAEGLPIMRHLDEYCKKYEFADIIKDIMQKTQSGKPVSDNFLRQFIQTSIPEYNAPHLDTVTGFHTQYNFSMTVPAYVDTITRKVSFSLPKEFQNRLFANTTNKQPVLPLSEIQKKNKFEGTELWYDDSKTTENIDVNKPYHLCVDESGYIPILTAKDLLILLHLGKGFYESTKFVTKITPDNESKIETFYLYNKNREYIGSLQKETNHTFHVICEKEFIHA